MLQMGYFAVEGTLRGIPTVNPKETTFRTRNSSHLRNPTKANLKYDLKYSDCLIYPGGRFSECCRGGKL